MSPRGSRVLLQSLKSVHCCDLNVERMGMAIPPAIRVAVPYVTIPPTGESQLIDVVWYWAQL